MEKGYDNQLPQSQYKFSDLQKKILPTICLTKNADYETLQRETQRRRSTIVQSLEPLRKYHYVQAQPLNPELPKSKLIFTTTDKGFWYAIAFLNVDLDDLIKLDIENDEQQMKEYTELMTAVKDYNGRKEFLYQTAKEIMNCNPFDENGMFVTHDAQGLINLGFMYALQETPKQNNPESVNPLRNMTLESLKKICRPDELSAAKEFILQNFKPNFDLMIKQLSDEDVLG
jgi:hypothetical protein